MVSVVLYGPGSRNSDWLRAGRSGDRIGFGARFSTPVQTGPGAHPASCTVGTVSFQEVKSGRDVTLTPHPILVPWSRKSRAIPLLPLWAVRHVQSLSACTRLHFTFIVLYVWNHIRWWDKVCLRRHYLLSCQDRYFWKIYDLEFTAFVFALIVLSKKIVCRKKEWRLEIDSAASTGVHCKLTYFMFLSWPVVNHFPSPSWT